MYYFEEVIRAVSGRPDFSLPYWNYASNDNSSLRLPAAFTTTTSSLFEEDRGDGWTNPNKLTSQTVPMNQGGYLGYPLVTYQPSLQSQPFFPADASSVVFLPNPAWFNYGYTGRTETQPHDNVHDGVGGLMGNVPTAALDPIFYMHHCQIDHLWASWQAFPGSKMNFAAKDQGTADQPTIEEWRQMKFPFVDGSGTLVSVGPLQAVDYKALGYSYDFLARNLPHGRPRRRSPRTTAPRWRPRWSARRREFRRRQRRRRRHRNHPQTEPPAQGSAELFAAESPPAVLSLQNVKVVKSPPAPLYVFVNLPKGAEPEVFGPYYVGSISPFVLSAHHGAGGMAGHDHAMELTNTLVYDVRELLRKQREAGSWNGGPVKVTVSTVGARGKAGDVYLTFGGVELRR